MGRMWAFVLLTMAIVVGLLPQPDQPLRLVAVVILIGSGAICSSIASLKDKP